jgi:hypothetical protein
LGIMLENIKLKILKGQRLLPLIRNIQKMWLMMLRALKFTLEIKLINKTNKEETSDYDK